MTGAVAIWVKTPGLSPVKTRLARSIGTAAAEEFHRLSADAVRAVVQRCADDLPGLVPYWAVAERGAEAWREFRTVHQGPGDLGARLSHVYDALLERHRFAIFLGADAPQLAPGLLERAASLAGSGAFVLGPADDGGFYLFAGSRPVPRRVWTEVPYSARGTHRALAAGLDPLGRVETLPPAFDVDTRADLVRLRAALARREGLLPEQRALRDWLERLALPEAGDQ